MNWFKGPLATLIFAISLSFARPSYASCDWSQNDRLLLATGLSLSVAEVLMTREILSNGGTELNPVFTSHRPSDAQLAAALVAYTGIVVVSSCLIPEWRTEILTASVVIGAFAVGHNVANLSVQFSF